MPTKATTLRGETWLLSCTKAWCLCSWGNGGIWPQTMHLMYYGTKATQCIRNLMTFSTTQCTQRCQCWNSGGKQKRVLYVTLTTSTFLNLETLFFFFHFLLSYLCKSSFGLLLWSLHHFVCDLNWLAMGTKIEFVYNVLSFVRNCILILCPYYFESTYFNIIFNNLIAWA